MARDGLKGRLAWIGVLGLRVYADRDYLTPAVWEEYSVADFDEGARRGEGWSIGDACWRGEGPGAAAGGAGEAVRAEENHVCDRELCGFGRDAEGGQGGCAG